MKKWERSFIAFLLALFLIAPAFAWDMERPSAYVVVDERAENANADNEAAAGIGVHMRTYHENSPDDPFANRDGIILSVVGTANTRKSIWYLPSVHPNLYVERFSLPSTLSLGDDDAENVPILFPVGVAFYSGPGLQDSSLYSTVCICSNGFICFNGDYPNVGPPTEICDSSPPNTFIAPYWSDLDPSTGVIRYGTTSSGGISYFGVEWDNVLDKANNVTQTFAVLIQARSSDDPRLQNRIIFQYYDVDWSSSAFWGIEDQEGCRGIGAKGPIDGRSIVFEAQKRPAAIREMSIIMEKQDTLAEVDIGTDPWEVAGVNLRWESTEPPPDILHQWYSPALKGTATLLMSKFLVWLLPPPLGPVAGLLLSGAVIGYNLIDGYVSTFRKPEPTEMKRQNANITQNIAYIKVPATGNDPSDYPVDAEISAQIYWIFNDANTENHSITITTQLNYYSLENDQFYNLTTSVDITVVRDTGNSFNDPNVRTVYPGTYLAFVGEDVSHGSNDFDDYYKLNVGEGMVLHLTMTPANDTDFDLYLYDPSGQFAKSSKRGRNVTEEISYPTNVSGNWFIRVNAVHGFGLYTLTVDEPYPAPRVTLLTKTTTEAYIDNVWVGIIPPPWYPGPWYKSQIVNKPVLPGYYFIWVETNFQRGHYSYTFQYWNDGQDSDSRDEEINSNITLIAYYEEQFFNAPPNTPSTPSGPNVGYAGTTYSYSTNTNDPNGDNVRYEFDWGDYTPHTITDGWSPSGQNVSATHWWGSPGTYNVQVRAQDCPPYQTWSGWSLKLQVSIGVTGGGDGCPMLFVWNGTNYSYEGLLNIHNTEGIDMLTNHTLLTTPQRVGYTYLFNLIEHPQTHSYIDQVKLYAILENGMVIQLPLIWAWHSEYGNVLPQLFFSDDWRTETIGANHNNGTSQNITLKFLALPPQIKVTAFIFQIEGYNPEFKV
jgi:hypothetical protein